MSHSRRTGERHAGFSLVLAWLGGAILAGALAAPWVWRALLWIGRRWRPAAALRDLQLADIAARAVLLAVIVLAFPVMRWATGRSPLHLWRGGLQDFFRHTLWGWLLGAVSVGVVAAAGALGGAYYLDPPGMPAIGLAIRCTGFLAGAILVAAVEETIFRGGIFGLLRSRYRFWTAAGVGSLIYSAVHFAKPQPAAVPVYGGWDEGLRLIGSVFAGPWQWHDGFAFVTLFCLGVVFCIAYECTGRLYLAAGLHAGIVFAVKVTRLLLDRRSAVLPVFFGPSTSLVKAPAATVLALGLLAAAVWWWGSRDEPA